MKKKDTLEEKLENIYSDATEKLNEITARHKKEIDEYVKELNSERIKKLKGEINA